MERPYLIEFRTSPISDEWIPRGTASTAAEASGKLAELERILDPYEADMQSRARVRDLRL